jgi:putative ABC transport system ATP-binding protein
MVIHFSWKKQMTSILTATALTKSYYLEDRRIMVLNGIDLDIMSGEFVVISGSSGSGKTTLLSLLSGLDHPDSGRIVLGDKEITSLTEEELAPVRNTMTGFVYQNFHLIPSLNALENVMFPAELRGDREARKKALELLGKVGLGDRTKSFPTQLSGGEQQRVAICRAIINKPLLLFADEPTGNLDSVNSDVITDLLVDLHRNKATTLVMATHSTRLADRADRIIHLHDGWVSPKKGD